MRRFEFVGGGSNKFWEVSQEGTQLTVHFGRMDTKGQTQTKDLGSWDAAAERVRKLIQEKLKEGYREVGGQEPKGDLGEGKQRPATLPPYEVPPIPNDGPLEIGGVQLPAGRRRNADPKYSQPGVESVSAPVLWATDGPVGARTLHFLRGPAAAIRLVPVLLVGLDDDPKRPWDSGEFSPIDPRQIDSLDAAEELARAWKASFDEEDPESVAPVKPFGFDFPGLASAPALVGEPQYDIEDLARLKPRRIALIAAGRPADAITAVGWMGAVNVHQDPALMSAILRSWEDRWRARVVEIGFDTLTLTVGNPPRDEPTAMALAAEHTAFCPDNIWQGSETLVAYAKSLVGSRTWSFWWD